MKMKNLKYAIIFALFLSACQSKEVKELNEFIVNFDEIELPYSFNADKEIEISDFKKIEEEKIGILQDSTNNAIYKKESDVFYVGKISTDKDFNVLIVGEYILEDYDSYLIYTLFTTTKIGKILSSISFSQKLSGFDEVEHVKCFINKNLEIERIRYGDIYENGSDTYINSYEIIENYKIEDTGNIKYIKTDEVYSEVDEIVEEESVEFKQLDLPYTIKQEKLGEQIKNKEQIS